MEQNWEVGRGEEMGDGGTEVGLDRGTLVWQKS